MAISVPRSWFTDAGALAMKSAMSITPKMAPWMQKKFKGASVQGVDIMKSDKTEVRLPFLYASNYCGTNNDGLNHAKVKMEFTGMIRDEQRPYINTAIDQLNKKRTTILNLRPGFGKTTMASAISSKVALLTVVIIFDSNLYKQWAKTYRERTTAVVWCVGEEKAPPTVDVIICLWTRTKKIDKVLRDYVGFMIIDEAHEACNQSSVNAILDFTPKYILGATATFERVDEMHKCMEMFMGTEKVDSDYKVPFTVTRYETGIKGVRQKKNGVTDWPTLNQSLLYNEQRNIIAIQVIKRALAIGRKILVFTTEVEHVKIIHKMLQDGGICSCDWLAGDKKSYKNGQVLVGNIQKCGTGFDEEMFCDDFDGIRIDTVILLGSFRNIALLYQVCGRAFRAANPWVIDFVDDDSTIQSQYKDRHWWYENNGGTIFAERHVPATAA
jgi:superfamily II DNA or RNA helicase